MSESPSNLLAFPGVPPYPPSADLRTAYLRLRGAGLDHSGALKGVGIAAEKDLLEGVERAADLEALAIEEGWARAYEASVSSALFADPDLSPEAALRILIAQQRQARRLLEGAQRVLEGPPPMCGCEECQGSYQASVHGEWPNPAAQSQWRAARRDWVECSAQVQSAAERAQRVLEEGSRSGYWQAQYDSTLSELLGAYLDGGPQYGVLCRSLASLDVRIRQMERSGRDFSSDEYAKLVKLRLESINQLQRYTESTKAESTSGVQNAVVKIATELEKRFKQSAPETWSLIAQTIAQTVQQNGLGLDLPA